MIRRVTFNLTGLPPAPEDVKAFVEESFNVMRAAYPFADNPYLQETVENLQPAMSRAYFLALEQRKAEMSEFLDLFQRLLVAVLARDLPPGVDVSLPIQARRRGGRKGGSAGLHVIAGPSLARRRAGRR